MSEPGMGVVFPDFDFLLFSFCERCLDQLEERVARRPHSDDSLRITVSFRMTETPNRFVDLDCNGDGQRAA